MRLSGRLSGPVERLHFWSAAVTVGGFATALAVQFGLLRWYRPDQITWFDTVWETGAVVAVVLLGGNMGVVAVAVCWRVAGRARADGHTNELLGMTGRCRRCGFDLRAAMDVRCPECGTYHGSRPARRFARR